MLFFALIEPLVFVVACAHVITGIKWRRGCMSGTSMRLTLVMDVFQALFSSSNLKCCHMRRVMDLCFWQNLKLY